MKRIVFGIVLMGAMSAGSLFAQSGYWGYDHGGDGRYNRQDLRHDYARIQRQQDDLYRDQSHLRHELREGDYREAQRIRQDMWRDRQRLENQRQDVRRDWRDRDRDRRDRW